MRLMILAAILTLGGCASPTAPTGPDAGYPLDPTHVISELQAEWCAALGTHCTVWISDAHPEWAAWVNIHIPGDNRVFWNPRVLEWPDRAWATSCRMAHEAAHVAGAHDEEEATRVASEVTGQQCRL